MLWLNAPRWLVAGLCVRNRLGSTSRFVPVLWHELGVVTFLLIVFGGVVCSRWCEGLRDAPPDPMPSVFGFHEVFRTLVITAGLIFYAAIARVIVAG